MPCVRRASLDPPDDYGVTNGLAWSRWLPAEAPRGALLALHAAGSCTERPHPFARACRAAGLAALVVDLRGHGESEGALGARVLGDLAKAAGELPAGVPLALRGSSMGGYLALVAAGPLGARAVVAICPASAEMLRRGLRSGAYDVRADADALDAVLGEHDALLAVQALDVPLLLLH